MTPTTAALDSQSLPIHLTNIGAVPTIDGGRALQQIEGTPPSIFNRPRGCAFHPRCPRAETVCTTDDPALRPVAGTDCACHLPLDTPAMEEPA